MFKLDSGKQKEVKIISQIYVGYLEHNRISEDQSVLHRLQQSVWVDPEKLWIILKQMGMVQYFIVLMLNL